MNLKLSTKFYNQSGQALLLVLLAMAVILTVVLSVSNKSVSDVSIGTYEEDALRAFSAAEAGIERALLTNQAFPTPQPVTSGSDVNFTSSITYEGGGATFQYPKELVSGESATFWMVGHDASGNMSCPPGVCTTGTPNIYFCWGNGGSENVNVNLRPAIVASLFYDDSQNPADSNRPYYLSGDFSKIKVSKLAFDYNAGAHANNFTVPPGGINPGNCNVNGKQYMYRSPVGANQSIRTLPTTNECNGKTGCAIMIRVAMYYNDTPQPVLVKGPGASLTLPPQGIKIQSTGVAGNSQRKINVFRSFAEPPEAFDSVLFINNNIP